MAALANAPASITIERELETFINTISAGANVSFIRNHMEALPESVRSDIELQSLAEQISQVEKRFIPAYYEFRETRLTNHPERYVLLWMGVLFVVGFAASLHPIVFAIAVVIALLSIIFYFFVKYRVHREVKQEMLLAKDDIRSLLLDFAQHLDQLEKAKRGGDL